METSHEQRIAKLQARVDELETILHYRNNSNISKSREQFVKNVIAQNKFLEHRLKHDVKPLQDLVNETYSILGKYVAVLSRRKSSHVAIQEVGGALLKLRRHLHKQVGKK